MVINLRSSNSFNWFFRKLFGPKIQQTFDPISIILTQMDFLHDIILVTRLITLLGGIVVFTNPQIFSSNVSNLMKYNYLFFSFTNFFYNTNTNFSGNLSVTFNNFCSTILGNHELCSIKSSKQK